MNKKLLVVILVLSVLLAAGCAQITANSERSEDPSPRTESQAENKTDAPGIAASPVVSKFKLEKIQGDIKSIHYADGNKVLISADKLYLYDLSTGDVEAEAPREAFEGENYWVIDNGYVAVGVKINSGNGSGSGGLLTTNEGTAYSAVFYDRKLNNQSEFNFNALLDSDDILSTDSFSFSSDGNQVAIATLAGLYLYDFKMDKMTTVIDLGSEDRKRSGLATIEQIGFTNEDKTIAFKAQSLDVPSIPGKPSFDTCGTVNTDGSGLSNRTFDNYICKELTAYNKLLFLAEDFTVPSGRILVMETPSGKTKFHTLTEKSESGFVTGSDSGRYFATSLADKNGTGWKIRVYNTETGKLEAEQLVSSDGKELYMARDPKIKVIDDLRTCIVLLGSTQTDIETKVVVSQF
ncbi:transcriptional regulator [Paenibacillus sp. J2TS4]|uniref:transcriptional regulator n=1 Tax=Paenibacillus sp. J2TS4 TaxID=2807194 RepID=UPI001B11C5B9|nr:transcriptional regulator [Paenibacillus sp. J2TS4]GIP35357.1 hypothetical protein J2TS4_45670 [Paenibacillus sp. J2TS4]